MARYSIILLFLLVSYDAVFGQTQSGSYPLKGMTLEQQKNLVRSILRDAGIPESQIPDIRISSRVVTTEIGTTIGAFLSPDEPFENTVISVPTLVVYPNATPSVGALEIAVRHEYLHQIAEQSPPTKLQDLWKDLREEVISSFDFSDVPGSLREAMISNLVVEAKELVEHIYIAEKLLSVAKTLRDARNAIKEAKYQLDLYREQKDHFYSTPQSVYQSGREIPIKPKAPGASGSSSGHGGLSGIYDKTGEGECEQTGTLVSSLQYDDEDGTTGSDFKIVSSDEKVTMTVGPIEISQSGSTLNLQQKTKSIIAAGKYRVTDNHGKVHTHSRATDYSMEFVTKCEGAVSGSTINIKCTQTMTIPPYKETPFDGDHMEESPGFHQQYPVALILEILPNGQLSLNGCLLRKR